MVEVEGLAKRYGDVWALRELSLSVAAGECLVLLGRNGAGKTTALRCVSGLVPPTAGRVCVGGYDSVTDGDAVRAQVGLMPEAPGLYERMSAFTYLDHFGAVYGLAPEQRRRRISALLERFGLDATATRWLGTYSKGMRQKVALIRATLHRPRVILADEPTSALDPDSARRAWDYLRDLQREGSALVICTHDMDEAAYLAGRIGIMSGGRLLAEGTMPRLVAASGLTPRTEVVHRPTLEEVYLAVVGEEAGAGAEARPA